MSETKTIELPVEIEVYCSNCNSNITKDSDIYVNGIDIEVNAYCNECENNINNLMEEIEKLEEEYCNKAL